MLPPASIITALTIQIIMRRTQRPLNRKPRLRHQRRPMRHPQIIDHDLMRKHIQRIAQVLEHVAEQIIERRYDLGVRFVFLRELGFVPAELDFLRDDGGSDGVMLLKRQ